VDSIIATPDKQSQQVGRIFDLAATIATLLQSALAADPQASIDSVTGSIFKHYGIRPEDGQKFEPEARQMTFAALGWASMFFKPIINLRGPELHTSAGDQVSQFQKKNPRIIQRPIGAMLRALNAMLVLCGIDTSSLSAEQVLLVPEISYSNLRNVGGVSVIWVDDLSRHAEFIASQRQLKLFRSPSFCVQAYKQSDTSLLNRFVVSQYLH
jgi:hypothetical protein